MVIESRVFTIITSSHCMITFCGAINVDTGQTDKMFPNDQKVEKRRVDG